MRKKTMKNDLFYVQYPYRPELELPDNVCYSYIFFVLKKVNIFFLPYSVSSNIRWLRALIVNYILHIVNYRHVFYVNQIVCLKLINQQIKETLDHQYKAQRNILLHYLGELLYFVLLCTTIVIIH